MSPETGKHIYIDNLCKSSNKVEQYLELLEYYQKKLGVKKVTVFMQIGDFYEIYGIVYSDGKRVSNLWEVAENLILKIANKNQSVYKDKSIKVKMAGIPLLSIDKYMNTAVEDYGWTVVLIEQSGEGKDIVRFESAIVSPGTNSYSHQETNNLMVIHLEKVGSLINRGCHTLYAGISFLDCLTGESGIIEYPYKETVSDPIIYDEILKLITIKNPSEVIIYADKTELTESEIVNLFHLNYSSYQIILDSTPKKFIDDSFQKNIFNKIYNTKNQTGIQDIFQHIGVWEHYYCRSSLTIMLEYVVNRNPNILEKLNTPTMMFNVDNNLVLANNALEQLNIINNIKKNFHHQRFTSVYNIINQTKTFMGKRLLKNRLMNPIIDSMVLQERYDRIGDMIRLQNQVLSTVDTKKEQPIYKLRSWLTEIIDLQKLIRKFARDRLCITDINSFVLSLENTLNITKFLEILDKDKYQYILEIKPTKSDISNINKIIKEIKNTFILDNCNSSITKIEGNVFKKGRFPDLDKIQDNLDTDKNIIKILEQQLSIMIDSKGYQKDGKSLVNVGKNTRYGHYIYTTPTRIESLKKTIEKRGFNLKIGQYDIEKKDFTFETLGKGKVRIDLGCIHVSGCNLQENTDNIRRAIQKQFSKWAQELFYKHRDLLEQISQFIGEVDFIQSCSKTAIEKGYSCPNIDLTPNNSYLDCKDLRHPIVESIHTDTPYIPNDFQFGNTAPNGYLLFGVNAIGKSTSMKSIGVNLIMAQAGMYVAASKFQYKPFKYLFTRIQSNDNIFAGLSTFAVEMSEFKIIMKYADRNSIILGDELCSGTETLDATALVAAGIRKLSGRGANFIFATHLHYLSSSKYINDLDNVKKIHMSVSYDNSNKKLIYERKIKEGSGLASYGIEVCKSMKMDDDYMELAQQIRDELTANTDKILGKVSRYNNQKYISNCEVCQENVATDTHHIKYQCSADNQGMIEHWHKDSKFNLVGLCKECHQSVHSSPPRIKIRGYRNTTNGVELSWKNLK